MSVTNLFETRRRAYQLRTVTVLSGTYTARVGTTANDHIYDRVINGTAPCIILLPDGVYEGQRILITSINDHLTGTVAVTTTTGDGDAGLADVDEYISLEWVNSTSGWQTLSSNS